MLCRWRKSKDFNASAGDELALALHENPIPTFSILSDGQRIITWHKEISNSHHNWKWQCASETWRGSNKYEKLTPDWIEHAFSHVSTTMLQLQRIERIIKEHFAVEAHRRRRRQRWFHSFSTAAAVPRFFVVSFDASYARLFGFSFISPFFSANSIGLLGGAADGRRKSERFSRRMLKKVKSAE